MPQDTEQKHAYEHTAQEEKRQREEKREEAEIDSAALRADSHAGQQGLTTPDTTLIEGTEIKELHTMLPDFHKDELRRLLIVAPGTRLTQGGIYCDLRLRDNGELVAHGEEEVHEELLVPKHAVDHEIWNKLLRK
jgi:hypothetical protein